MRLTRNGKTETVTLNVHRLPLLDYNARHRFPFKITLDLEALVKIPLSPNDGRSLGESHLHPSKRREALAQPAPQPVIKQPKWSHSLDPTEYVNSAAISGDAARVVAGTFYHAYKPEDIFAETLPGVPPQPQTFTTYCYDLNGNLIWSDPFKGYEGVYCVAISNDGSTAASGGWYSYTPLNGFIRAYSASDGTKLFTHLIGARVNQLALSADGTTLVAAADSLYLFQQSDGVFSSTPSVFPLTGTGNSVQSVAISADGSSIVIGDAQGNVYLIENNNGQIGKHYIWNDPSLTTIHAVAMTSDGSWFTVVGSSQYVYLLTPATIHEKDYYATYDFGSVARCGWVAITDAGDFISVIQNTGETGSVYGLQNANQQLTALWSNPQSTLANPNSTSVDSKGAYVTVADGYPDNSDGHFYLFDGATGDPLWQCTTKNMNWPMFISSDGTGIVAGSDLGTVYYFTPA